MIDLVSTIIEEIIQEKFDSKIEAEYIIDQIEKAGMLPPRCELPKLGISDNAWESEDES